MYGLMELSNMDTPLSRSHQTLLAPCYLVDCLQRMCMLFKVVHGTDGGSCSCSLSLSLSLSLPPSVCVRVCVCACVCVCVCVCVRARVLVVYNKAQARLHSHT